MRGKPNILDAGQTARTWDVIIVGGGPAGCVLARRMSDDRQSQVLLIEAGPDAVPGREHPDILDPFPVASSNRNFHWPGLMVEIGANAGSHALQNATPYVQGY